MRTNMAKHKPNGEIKIEKGVPVPMAGSRHGWPFDKMEVGESFTVPHLLRSQAGQAAGQWKRRHPGFDYTTRRVGELVRIWRIAAFTAALLLTAPVLAGDHPDTDGCYRGEWFTPWLAYVNCGPIAADNARDPVLDTRTPQPPREPPPHECPYGEKPGYQGGERGEPRS